MLKLLEKIQLLNDKIEMLSEEDFFEMTGHESQQDDMERVNCENPGQVGHSQCGICSEHQKPRFICGCSKN